MRVTAIFYSVQGEGISLGIPSIFIRCTGCNFNPPCVFCDTKYSLKGGTEKSVDDIVKEVLKFPCRNVVWTGGEPLCQQKGMKEVMELLLLKSPFYNFAVETNGSLTPSSRLLDLVDEWIVSPKLSNSGVKPYKIPHAYFDNKRGDINLKFVVDSREDLDEIYEYLNSNKDFSYLGPEGVFLMPQAITTREHNEKLPFIIEFAKKYGCRVSPRLHILAYGNKRGV